MNMERKKFHFWIGNLYFIFSRAFRTLYRRLKIEDGKNPKCCRSRKAPAGKTFTKPNPTNNSAFRKIFLLNESQVIIHCNYLFGMFCNAPFARKRLETLFSRDFL